MVVSLNSRLERNTEEVRVSALASASARRSPSVEETTFGQIDGFFSQLATRIG